MKAVIMAGGNGKRLRPMTSTVAKPLVRVFSRPVLAYIFDLLKANSFDDVTVTLGYMAEQIENYILNDYPEKLKITAVKEEKALGTAGGVRNAAKNINEPFLVISGDGICDFDLKKIMDFHLSHKGDVTIVLTRVKDPREYGVVEVDKCGKVKAFTEKPSWAGAYSNLVNTGIYIINPSVLKLIPENEPFDFSKDLFPTMMEKNRDIFSYIADGYWCDIGNTAAYRQCCDDIMNGVTKIQLPQVAQGIFTYGKLPQGKYSIVPPCYIGQDVEIGDGAVIGPYSVIDDGCMVGENSKIYASHMLPFSAVYPDSTLNRAVLCENAVVKSSVKVYENSVIGAGSTVNRSSVICKNVLVWPDKVIESGSKVNENVKFGGADYDLFGDDEIFGTMGVEINSVTASKIGQAIASSVVGSKTGIAFDNSVSSKAVAYSVIGGLVAHASHVRVFSQSFLSQMMYNTAFCGLECGIFVSHTDNEISVKICGEGGLPLQNSVKRDIVRRMKFGEFKRPQLSSLKDVSDMSGIGQMYRRELIRQSPTELSDISCSIKCRNNSITMLMDDCLYRLGAKQGDEITFRINNQGTMLSAFHRDCGWVPFDKLMAVCCMAEVQNGHDVAIPFSAPHIIDKIAAENGKRALRYYDYPTDNSDTQARTLAQSQMFVRDALFMAVKILGIICESGVSLGKLLSALPKFYVTRKNINLNFSPGEITRMCKSEDYEVTKEGIIIRYPGGRVFVSPSQNGKFLRMMSEANSYEISKELCFRAENLLNG